MTKTNVANTTMKKITMKKTSLATTSVAKLACLTFIVLFSLTLQGCIHKIVTVPVKVAYGVTKGVVKGTTAVVGAVIPDGDDSDDAKEGNKKSK